MSRDAKSNIERIAAILKGFDALNTPRRTQDVLEDLGATRSTGFGLLRAMVRAGWLERYDHGLVQLGPKVRAMAFAPLEAMEPSDAPKIRATPGGVRHAQGTPDLEWDPDLVRTVETSRYRSRPPYRIGFANASVSNDWRRAMQESLAYAEKTNRHQIAALLMADAKDDPKLQRQQIDDLVSEGIDILLISTASVADSDLSNRLKELADEGLPIVAVDRRPNDRSSLTAFVTASDHRIGRVSALWLAEHLGGQGRVWMLSGLEGASPAIRRQQAALSVLSQFPGIQVEFVSHTDWTPEGGHLTVGRLMDDAGRPPDGVWCDSGLQGMGSVRQFLDRGLDVPAHTGGDLNGMYKLCLEQKVPMVALDYPASMGARALEVALDILQGQPVPQRVEVPVQIILPRGQETQSVKADTWAELHVQWSLADEAILSQGPALQPSEGRVAS
ncbi:MAG: substrate-binding domain-containing protein, partial [Pseudomonadota bacterium]